jgi:hypothetical protein
LSFQRTEELHSSNLVLPLAFMIALSVIVVCVLDVISTNAGLLAGAVELNPLFAALQASMGEWWVAPKVGLQLITAAIVVLQPSRTVFACVGAVVVFNAAVVFNNFGLAGVL